MTIQWLAPWALAAGPLALLAAAAVVLARRRSGQALAVLRLAGPTRRRTALLAVGALAGAAVLIVAAARPVLVRAEQQQQTRTDAQLYVVLDTSRSMSARATPTAPTRLDRAIRFAEDLRARLPSIPAGVASFTDRVLPHLVPTTDTATFDATLRQAIGIGRPPPQSTKRTATDYTVLAELPAGNAYTPGVRRRLLVLLTDGESAPYRPGTVVQMLRRQRTALIVVRFWAADERVFEGPRETSYRPQPASAFPFVALGASSVGGRVFGDGDAGAAAAAAKRFFGAGPLRRGVSAERRLALGPYLAAAALVLLAAIVIRRGGYLPTGTVRTWRHAD